MTVPASETAITRHVGNGNTSVFDYGFKITDQADLLVKRVDNLGNETTLALTTEYTVSGVGNNTGGSITLVAGALPSGYLLSIEDNIVVSQPTPYGNQLSFLGSLHEDSYDKNLRVGRKALTGLARSIKLPSGVSGVDVETPVPAALNLLRWDASATQLENVTAADIGSTLAFSNFIADTYVEEVDFTAGTTTQLSLTTAAGVKENSWVYFDGVYQEKSTYSIVNTVVTFTSEIPVGVSKIEIVHGTVLPQTSIDASAVTYTATGTGATQRILDDVLDDSFNVKSFGATGDGVTDDTSAIQACLDAAEATGGGIVFVPGGTYQISVAPFTNTSGGLIIRSNIHFMMSPNATLRAITNSSAVTAIIRVGRGAPTSGDAIDTTNVKISGGHIIGDRDTHTGSGEQGMGIMVVNAGGVRIDNVHIEDCWGDGIYIDMNDTTGPYGGSDTRPIDVVIENCRIIGNRRNNISVISCLGLLIDKNYIRDADGIAPMAGIDIEPDFTTNAEEIRITNNIILTNDGAGVELANTTSTGKINDVLIQGNVIRDNGAVLGFGIKLAQIQGSEIRIIGNKISHSHGDNIMLESTGSFGLHRILIMGNSIYEARKTSILFDSLTIDRGSGIMMQGTPARFIQIANNNIFQNDFYGVAVNRAADTVHDYIHITGNMIEGNSQDANNTYANLIIFGNSRNAMITNNIIHKDITGTLSNEPSYGIHVSGNGDDGVIQMNMLQESGVTESIAAPFATANNSSKWIIKDNTGHETQPIIQSANIDVSNTGQQTITTAHGIDDTPGIGNVVAVLSRSNTHTGTPSAHVWVDSVDGTNIVCIVDVTTAGDSADRMKINLHYRPSVVWY